MNYRRRSKAFHVAVVRHVSQTCRREKAARVDRSMHSVSVIVGSPCSCPTRNKSTALRTPRGDSEENWSIAKISLVLHATSDLFSLSLSRGSAVDLREMEEQGSDFHRRTSVFAGTGKKGRKHAVTERREPAQFLFLVARNGNAIGHFARPERLKRGSCWLRRWGEQFSLSLSLVWRKISNFIPRREMKRKSLFRELKRIKERNFENR